MSGSPHPPPPAPYVPAPTRPRAWWQRTGPIVALLLLLPPVGVVLVWLAPWTVRKKILATVLAGLWLLVFLFTDPPADTSEENRADAEPEATASDAASVAPATAKVPGSVGETLRAARQAATEAGFRTRSHDASEGDAGQWNDSNWTVCFQIPAADAEVEDPRSTTIDFAVVRLGDPCPEADGKPIPYPEMPDVVGESFEDAAEELDEFGLKEVEARSAHTDVTVPSTPDDWQVCFQHPAAGETVRRPGSTTARLSLVRPGTDCPDTEYTALDPDPPATGDDEDDSRATSTGSVGTGGASSGGSSGGSSSGGGAAPYYPNCAAAKADGAAPLYAGSPGYGRHLDRDGDGVACE